MGSFNLTEAMDGIAAAIVSWGGVTNVYAYPVESVTVPCALVDFPETIDLGVTFGRGGDHVELPVYFLVGRTSGKDSRDALSDVMEGGADIVAAIGGAYAWGDADVVSAEMTTVTIAETVYVGLRFTIDIVT